VGKLTLPKILEFGQKCEEVKLISTTIGGWIGSVSFGVEGSKLGAFNRLEYLKTIIKNDTQGANKKTYGKPQKDLFKGHPLKIFDSSVQGIQKRVSTDKMEIRGDYL